MVPLNRYLVDYFAHGQKSAVVEANGLREGDAWQVGSLEKGPMHALAISGSHPPPCTVCGGCSSQAAPHIL